MKSGIEAPMAQTDQLHIEKLASVLDRQTPLDPLGALVAALRHTPSAIPLQRTALGLDANVFLRLGGHKKGVDIIDYLSAKHSAPLILPGQAIQEFWNNQLQAVETVVSGLKKKFDLLKSDFEKVDSNFGDYAAKIGELLSSFNSEHGYIYDEKTLQNTLALLEMLQSKAITPYAPRVRFQEIANQRKRTKTPPGFKDDLDGDFYIWVDLLTGLQQAKTIGQEFERVVLVSHDQKQDWVRAGVAHPILTAEVNALLGSQFEIWTLDQLAKAISEET